jgi:YesN/AraC family two-component response regulator
MVSRIGLRRDLIGMFRELTLIWNGQQRGYAMKSRAMFTLILHRLLDIISDDIDAAPGDTRINRVIRYIAAHYGEKITVKALARRVDLDEAYLGYLFKRETGMMIHQYMAKVRIQNAENMLQSGNYKVEKVAELCGYSDYFHFFKSFKALRGFPPSRCLPRK